MTEQKVSNTRRQLRVLIAGLLVVTMIAPADVSAACTTYWNVATLGATQVDSIALYNRSGAPIARVTSARLKRLADIKDRLTIAANVRAPLLLCDDKAPNAYAEANLRLIIFTLGMLEMLEWNVDAIAAVMAHEVAHLALGHSGASQSKKALATLQALTLNSPNESAKPLDSRGIAPLKLGQDDLKTLFLLLYFRFSREDEKQADIEGMKLMTRTGINPEGAVNAYLTFLREFGDREGGYLDRHPSMKERAKLSLSYLATDREAKGLTAQIRSEAATDEEYAVAAERLIRSRSWKELDVLTNDWLSRGDQNSVALYYRGIYQSAGLNEPALARRTFYSAVAFDSDNAKARLELCVALFDEGRKLESTYCYRNIATSDDKEQFKARTFGDNLWIGGEIEPFTSVVATRDESGKKYITNSELAKQRGLVVSNFMAD